MTEPKSQCNCIDCNLPDVGIESLGYKPTIAELEKAIGTPDEMDILPNGDVRPKYPNICSKQPPKPSPATEENLTPVIESKTKVENSKVVSQPPEQPNGGVAFRPTCVTCKDMVDKDGKAACDIGGCNEPEQPNTELLIVKTIQGLMSAANNQLGGLEVIATTGGTTREILRLTRKALEEIDLFEKTTLFELQKECE